MVLNLKSFPPEGRQNTVKYAPSQEKNKKAIFHCSSCLPGASVPASLAQVSPHVIFNYLFL
jgi:hypothetical protein